MYAEYELIFCGESYNAGTDINTKNILHVGFGDLIAEASAINIITILIRYYRVDVC